MIFDRFDRSGRLLGCSGSSRAVVGRLVDGSWAVLGSVHELAESCQLCVSGEHEKQWVNNPLPTSTNIFLGGSVVSDGACTGCSEVHGTWEVRSVKDHVFL